MPARRANSVWFPMYYFIQPIRCLNPRTHSSNTWASHMSFFYWRMLNGLGTLDISRKFTYSPLNQSNRNEDTRGTYGRRRSTWIMAGKLSNFQTWETPHALNCSHNLSYSMRSAKRFESTMPSVLHGACRIKRVLPTHRSRRKRSVNGFWRGACSYRCLHVWPSVDSSAVWLNPALVYPGRDIWRDFTCWHSSMWARLRQQVGLLKLSY